MAKINKKETQELIAPYCEARKLSRTKLAASIGLSPATLSMIENGNWDNISNATWKRVYTHLTEGTIKLVNTLNKQTCDNVFNDARDNCKMIGIIGNTGLGKTTSAKCYQRKTPNCYYIRVSKSMLMKDVFIEILKAMGINVSGKVYELMKRTADELNKQTEPLLIIDEAGKLTENMILSLHDLRDRTERNAGIALVGMPYFKENLEKAAAKQRQGMAEFLRRITAWQELSTPLHAEIDAICAANGITDKDTVKSFYKIKDFGTLQNAIMNEKLLMEQMEAVNE